jgi:formylglycine-generating enzyme required for sulfatase activity
MTHTRCSLLSTALPCLLAGCIIERGPAEPAPSDPSPPAAADAGRTPVRPTPPSDAGAAPEVRVPTPDAGAPPPPVPDAASGRPDVRIVAPDAAGPETGTPAVDAATPRDAAIRIEVRDGAAGGSDAVAPPEAAAVAADAGAEDGTERFGIRFVRIPAGRFAMGSPESEGGRNPNEAQLAVEISRPFEISATEITQAQYRALVGSNPSERADCPDCPVDSVDWYTAAAFANRVSEAAGLPACYECADEGGEVQCSWARAYRRHPDCPGYRLPTDAEWEYAARAGTTTAFHNGPITRADRLFETGECVRDPGLDAVGWYCANSGERPHPVATKAPNAWGVYDMHGNVAEWTSSGDEPTPLGGTDPWSRGGFNRGLRGGAWYHDARTCRSAAIDHSPPYIDSSFHGIRLVRTLSP